MVVNVFDVDDVFWKRVTDQQLQQDASYEKKIAFLFVHWKEWDKPNPSQFIDYTKIMNKVRRSFPVQPPTVGYHLSGVKGHPRDVVGIFDENKFRIAWSVLVRDGSIIQQEETPKERLHTLDRDKSPLASRLHTPYGKYYYYDDVMDDGVTDNDDDFDMQVDDDGGVLIAAPGVAPLVVPARDDIGGEISDATAPGVASPVDPDSVIAMEVDHQDEYQIAAPSLAAAALRHDSIASEDAAAPSVAAAAALRHDDSSIASEDAAAALIASDHEDVDSDDYVDPEEVDVIPPEVEERVDDVDALVADDNPLYQAAQRPNLMEQMEEILHQFDEFDIRINEERSGGIVTQPPTLHVLERFGRFPIADVIDDKRNMNDDLLLKKGMQIKNDLSIPLAERSAIVKAIEYHRGICALAVEQSKEKKTLGYREFFTKYKGLGWERHHIVPRSCNGTNDDVNLVYISKTKHIKVHGYLSMMCTDSEIAAAFCFMTSQGGCNRRGVEIRDVVALLNDEGLLEELAIARSVYSTNLRVVHEKKRTGSVLDKFETKVRKTCLSLLYFVFIFVHYL